jgi:hypothetical protein
MSKKRSFALREEDAADPKELVARLFRDYASGISETLWPQEKTRWYELVFCILTIIGEPQVMSATIRRVTNMLVELGLVELGDLAKLGPTTGAESLGGPAVIHALLQHVGFTPEMSRSAVEAMREVALALQTKYEGKVQSYLRRYGIHMLDCIEMDFGHAQFVDLRKVVAMWLQNVANMPVPLSTHFAEQGCQRLGTTYDALAKAADEQDINVALLDDALRAYLEDMGDQDQFRRPASE